MFSKNLCVIIPTYNEKNNIQTLIDSIQEVFKNQNLKGWILIIDDNSPDGTGKIVERMKSIYKNLILKHRPKKLGIGSACVEGFAYAINELNSDILISMDADLSHDPKYLTDFLLKIYEGYDVVVGSRRIKNGKVIGWNFYRKLMSYVGNALARWLCGVKIKDATSGYRAYTKDSIIKAGLSKISSEGYAFQVEMLFRCQKENLRIIEVPITFINRKTG
ncbi:MAG: polyprenol monophosphomannose synthase, partial [Candidatus Bathyarchaeia archaeon]